MKGCVLWASFLSSCLEKAVVIVTIVVEAVQSHHAYDEWLLYKTELRVSCSIFTENA